MALPSGTLPSYPLTVSPGQYLPAEPRPLSWSQAGGWIPNFSAWRPGDILVFERQPASSGAMGLLIENFQKQAAPAAAKAFSSCTHCAVYLGDGLIADSRFRRRIGIRRLYPETFKRRICVWRLDPAIGRPGVLRRFVDELLDLEDMPYGATLTAMLPWMANNFLGTRPKGLVCSAYIEYAANRAGIAFSCATGVVGPMLPSSFMVHPFLQLVPAHWCRTL